MRLPCTVSTCSACSPWLLSFPLPLHIRVPSIGSRFQIWHAPSRLRIVSPPSLPVLYSYQSSRSLDIAATVTKEVGRGPASAGPPSDVNQGEIIDYNPPRGTRDFPPDEMRLRSWLFQKFREVSRLFAFEEVDFPVLESEALFVRKAGEEITQQLYNFEDKGGRRVALRPELTPSLVRLVLQKGKALSFPIKWFTIGQCWRYERMTRGRRREHYQWNMDIIGVSDVQAEAELLSAIVGFFTKVGITSNDVGIRVSSRKVLQSVLGNYVIPENSFAAVCVVVDKLDKIPREEIEGDLMKLGLSKEAIDGILHALAIRTLTELEELLGSENEAVKELNQLFAIASGSGFGEWLCFDASVVRGLAYYTGIVFEGFDKDGKLRAICGGGRYDRLLSTFGGPDMPACGFGFGDAVIVELYVTGQLLKEKGLIPSLQLEVDDIIFPLDENLRPQAAMIAHQMRNLGHIVELVLENKRLKWAFKHAERLKAKQMILLGRAEWERGLVRVKNLVSREERDILVDDLMKEVAE